MNIQSFYELQLLSSSKGLVKGEQRVPLEVQLDFYSAKKIFFCRVEGVFNLYFY